jgi:hypothetical protein
MGRDYTIERQRREGSIRCGDRSVTFRGGQEGGSKTRVSSLCRYGEKGRKRGLEAAGRISKPRLWYLQRRSFSGFALASNPALAGLPVSKAIRNGSRTSKAGARFESLAFFSLGRGW